MATFRGFLGDTVVCKALRFNSLQGQFFFIYFIYTIKCIIGAFMADANALLLYNPIREKLRGTADA